MAILKNGLYGKVSGKIGNTVTYSLFGKTVVRMVGKSEKPPTERQLANWQAMLLINRFLKIVKHFIDAGFALEARAAGMYPQNKAISVNKPAALKGLYPNLEIDYTKIVLSLGDLPGLTDLTCTLENDGIRFRWDPQTWIGWPYANDQVMLMAYLPEQQEACFVLSGAKRRMGYDFLDIPPALTGQRMEVYIAVVADNRKRISTSQYLGKFNS